jgi:ubiquinone/menaquinone biosynthesis C-methylase UbiE
MKIAFSMSLLFCLITTVVTSLALSLQADEKNSPYTLGPATRDGIGKFYMGREISKVMGHLGASWLERPKREQEERTDLLIKGLDLKPTDKIADIGAGSGYFSFRMAKLVPQGKVFAIDISPQMIGIVRAKMGNDQVTNIEPVQSTITQTKLPPNSVDAALIVDAYHEFSHPLEMATSILNSLKPGGKLILIEYRMEDPSVPIKLLHKMSEKQAKMEMKAAGFNWEKTLTMLPQQHFMVFRKPG